MIVIEVPSPARLPKIGVLVDELPADGEGTFFVYQGSMLNGRPWRIIIRTAPENTPVASQEALQGAILE